MNDHTGHKGLINSIRQQFGILMRLLTQFNSKMSLHHMLKRDSIFRTILDPDHTCYIHLFSIICEKKQVDGHKGQCNCIFFYL